MRKYTPLLLCMLFSLFAQAQNKVHIAIINDRPPDNALSNQYEKNLEKEIATLLSNEYELAFQQYYLLSTQDYSNWFDGIYQDNDIVITLGPIASNIVAQKKVYEKPTISSLVIDANLQGVQKTNDGTSGVNNFTYLESPFNIERDLNILYEIYPFDHLEVLTERRLIDQPDFITTLFGKYLKDKEVTVDHIFYDEEIAIHFEEMAGKNVAIYAFPYLGNDTSLVREIFKLVNEKKIPSSALFGESYLQRGAMVGYETTDNLQKIPRRIAIDVMKIVEGQNAADLNVEMQNFSDNMIINMETSRQIGIYPDFDVMSEATLINLEKIEEDKKLKLKEAIALALQNNLDIKVQQSNVAIAETEIGIAKASLQPQLDVNTSFQVLDELTTFTRQGTAGRGTWYVGGSLSQVVFSEPALANVAIQKLLQQSEEKLLLQTQMDVVIDVTNAYVNILFAKNNLNIQQQNVERNKENYDISKAKDAIGYAGASDRKSVV